jgi:hypothetical protein
MRAFIILGLLASGLAHAGEWAGVPLDRAAALGLGTPTVSEVGAGWRAPVPAGGFVAVEVFTDAVQAEAAFAHRSASSTTLEQPSLALADQAVGDGDAYVLVRDANVLIRVRALQGGATSVVERVRGALVTQAPAGVSREVETDAGLRRWDMVGREI